MYYPLTHAQAAKTLTPTMATSNPTLLSTNTLHEIDQAAQVGTGEHGVTAERQRGKRKQSACVEQG